MNKLLRRQLSPSCGLITANISPDCDNPLVGGLEVDLILINKDHITSMTFDATNPLIVTAITLSASNKGYMYTGIKNSNSSKATLLKGKYTNTYEHEIGMVVFKVNGDAKKQIELLSKGLVVAVVRNKYRGTNADSAFEIFGREQGLEVATLERDVNNADTQGGFMITLKTPDVGKEAHLPAPFVAPISGTLSQYASTLAAYNNLYTP